MISFKIFFLKYESLKRSGFRLPKNPDFKCAKLLMLNRSSLHLKSQVSIHLICLLACKKCHLVPFGGSDGSGLRRLKPSPVCRGW